ncbi:MAG: RNA polymerase sigma-70 factor [Bacteroidota bacterium]
MTQPNQDHFIEGLRRGDKQVFEQIFNTWYEPLSRYCTIRLGNQEDAEEIVQDIFVKLWVKRNELTITTSLKPYLYRMALNKIINHQEHLKIRLQHKEAVRGENRVQQPDSSLLNQKELMAMLAKAVAMMPKKRRMVYEYSRNDGMTYAQIAEKMEISVKTVEAHLSAALEHLRKNLRDFLTVTVLLPNAAFVMLTLGQYHVPFLLQYI